MTGFVSRGFVGRRTLAGDAGADVAARIPPGQHLVSDFPVLSAGPTPRVPLDRWSFEIAGLVRTPVRWTWDEFQRLPAREFRMDLHCVTKWTKLDTTWRGVSVDVLLESAELLPDARFAITWADPDYTTNLPLPDLLNGQAYIALEYEGAPLAPEHGGPARLLVPNRYLWKSAKWVRGIEFTAEDRSGFWESLGYNNHGDPWREERYTGD
jgi:DMSO/TMAO reductase YedYZ molybdopterin-dependent catalytic subunit